MSKRTKTCGWCKTPKPLTAFGNNRTKPDGRETACKDCRNADRRTKNGVVHFANGLDSLCRVHGSPVLTAARADVSCVTCLSLITDEPAARFPSYPSDEYCKKCGLNARHWLGCAETTRVKVGTRV